MRGRLLDIRHDIETGKQQIVFELNHGEDFREYYDDLKEKELEIDIRKYYPARSLSANAYLWKLLGDIAKVLHSSELKLNAEDIYKQYIQDYGSYTIVAVNAEAVDSFIKAWRTRGDKQKRAIGWFAEPLSEERNGKQDIVCYYGTSAYDSREFSRLLEAVIQDCKDLGIPTRPQSEIDEMIEAHFK